MSWVAAHPGPIRYHERMTVDARVAALLAQRDYRSATEEVMREHGPAIRGLLLTLFRSNRDAAEDAFSLFAENLCRHLPEFRGESSVRTWAYCVGRNAALTVTREGWRRLGRRLDTVEAERLAEEVRTRSAVRLERQSGALAALRDALDLDEQTLLTLRLDERLPWDEIALILSSGGAPLDAATARKRFERLKAKLSELARRQGILR
jgi:RNA polymerase sigma-70 factor (ECF subfamily)